MLFAIGDLHLPGGEEKPMDVFGTQWGNHFEKISASWRAQVGENDTVLIPGDISWAMQLENAVPDLQQIALLPGRKILLRGNHDYWWSSVSKVRAILPQSVQVIQNDAIVLPEAIICGTRGWTLPQPDKKLPPEDEKINQREIGRLKLTLDAARRKADGRPIVAMMHYPPFNELHEESSYTDLLEAFGVSALLYGHLHGASTKTGYTGLLRGVYYQLVSCDAVNFEVQPVLL